MVVSEESNKTSVFVRGLGPSTTDDDLHSMFSNIGPIRRAFVVREHSDSKVTAANASKNNTTSCRGYGFVHFALHDHAKLAIQKMNNTKVEGRTLRLDFAKPRLRHHDETQLEQQPENNKVNGTNRHEPVRPTGETPQRSSAKEQTPDEPTEKAVKINNVKAVGSLPKRTAVVEFIVEPSKQLFTLNEEQKLFCDSRVKPKSRQEFVESIVSSMKPKVVAEVHAIGERIHVTFDSFFSARDHINKLHHILYHKLKASDPNAASSSSASRVVTCARIESVRNSKRSRIIVRNLPFNASVADVLALFRKCGPVRDVLMKTKDSGSNVGYCFVEYFFPADAEMSVMKVNGEKMKDRVIAVDHAVAKNIYELQQKDENVLSDSAAPKADNGGQEREENEEEPGDDDESSDDGGETQQKRKEGASSEEELGRTVFVRNLLFEMSAKELRREMMKYGDIEQCVLVVDKHSGKPRGTAFVRFTQQESVDAVLHASGYGMKYSADSLRRTSVMRDDSAGIVMEGRHVLVFPATNKSTAESIAAELEKETGRRKEDRRNLWLAWEGYVEPGSIAAKGLSEDELEKRRKAAGEKKLKLSSNPNIFVSTTRLSIRNIPRDVSERELKQLCAYACTRHADAAGSSGIGNVRKVITQAKVVADAERDGRSKGYGFVEFVRHEDALNALRALNNNPRIIEESPLFKSKERSGRRLIVEFALEDKRKLELHQKTIERAREKVKKELSGEIGEEKQKKESDKVVARKKTKYEKIVEKRERKKKRKQEQREKDERDPEVEELIAGVDEGSEDEMEFDLAGDEVVEKKKRTEVERDGNEKSRKKQRVAETQLDLELDASLLVQDEAHVNGKGQKRSKRKQPYTAKEQQDESRLDSMIARYHNKLFDAHAAKNPQKPSAAQSTRWFDN